MSNCLVIGNRIVRLREIDSTNQYMQNLQKEGVHLIEGLVVIADHQTNGRGQRGNNWEVEKGKNITCSIYLTPHLEIQNQFGLSKLIALSIVDFLSHLGLNNVSIKWPNDIYVNNKKIAGILIENSIRNKRVVEAIVGIGLNVNQVTYPDYLINPTSIKQELESNDLEIKNIFQDLLAFIDKRYVKYRSIRNSNDDEYLKQLYALNQLRTYEIDGIQVQAKIKRVNATGQIILDIAGKEKAYDFQQIKYIFSK